MKKNGSLSEAADVLRQADRVAIATHVQPDGDGLGSLLGLATALNNAGKEIYASWGEKIVISPQYSWLPNLQFVKEPDNCPEYPVFVALDCATLGRLGSLKACAKKAEVLLNIDHHADNTLYGKINVIQESASATCQMVYELLKLLNWNISEDIATVLYTGIVTDTGRFQYDNTDQETFRVAGDLLGLGAQPTYVFQNVYENISYEALKLLGFAMAKAEFHPEVKFIYTVITKEDLALTSAGLEETENFIDHLRSVKSAQVAAILKEAPNGVFRVSMRSKGQVDVEAIASDAGGGGHRNAAGFTSKLGLIETVDWIIGKLREQNGQTESKTPPSAPMAQVPNPANPASEY